MNTKTNRRTNKKLKVTKAKTKTFLLQGGVANLRLLRKWEGGRLNCERCTVQCRLYTVVLSRESV